MKDGCAKKSREHYNQEYIGVSLRISRTLFLMSSFIAGGFAQPARAVLSDGIPGAMASTPFGTAVEAVPGGCEFIQVGLTLPSLLDLRGMDPARYIPADPRHPGQVESARLSWEALIGALASEPSLRLSLPPEPHGVPLLLAAAQALRAKNPAVALYLAFDSGIKPLWDENAWGALNGGVLTPEDLGGDPALWAQKLARAQEVMPGRPWFLWLDKDPGEYASVLMGQGGRLVIPAGGASGRLMDSLNQGFTDIEGALGDLTLCHASTGERVRWRFQAGEWKISTLPDSRAEVPVLGKVAYDVGALLAKARATQQRDRAATLNSEARMDVDLHMQTENSTGTDLGLTFTAFEEAGDGEEMLQKEARYNGVKAKIPAGFQIPIVEAQPPRVPPLALGLTEVYRYSDGGRGDKKGTRRVRFEPLTPDGALPTGEVLVDELSGRILEERSSRSDIMGTVKSEQRVFRYGEVLPGFHRLLSATTFERWVMGQNIFQVQRKVAYSQFRINTEDFQARRAAARASKATMIKQTVEGLRYFNLKNGGRAIEQKRKSSALGIGGMVLIDPNLKPPVFPMGGLAYFDINALDKDIQVTAVTGVVYNMLAVNAPRLPWGFNMGFHMSTMLWPITERPVNNGRLLSRDAVGRQWAQSSFTIGKDIGLGFNLECKGTLNYNKFSQAREKEYQTPGFELPPSGVTRGWRSSLSWQRSGFQLTGHFGESERPAGTYGTAIKPQEIPLGGHMESWGASAAYDTRFAKSWWLHGEAGFSEGRGYDRFASLGIGNYAKGIRSYSVTADRVHYANIGIVTPSNPLFRLTFTLDHARARSLDDRKTYGFSGLGISGDLPGFWWFTSIRLDLGIGLYSDIPAVRGVNGHILFLKVF